MQAAVFPLYVSNQSTATSNYIYREGEGWLDSVCVSVSEGKEAFISMDHVRKKPHHRLHP